MTNIVIVGEVHGPPLLDGDHHRHEALVDLVHDCDVRRGLLHQRYRALNHGVCQCLTVMIDDAHLQLGGTGRRGQEEGQENRAE